MTAFLRLPRIGLVLAYLVLNRLPDVLRAVGFGPPRRVCYGGQEIVIEQNR
jgi:hypothetical protein